ncbi:MAG: ATP-binding protein [Candidatus Eisenbacteria bacterium]|uniref:ATP-binding protein n=1 Tax=Eiseniibacteriota bacterium TaxID=2212470 RepID=A0A948WCZ8_UNCEI|nr:ATP-binding protein [Candidatus Eisenbacteria bacterium]MBU1948829.1 ATP-binding protein [Candidatus Eisenbacteria bacterium]MBU2691373.1 ATP-binding protein [Candidatus Eisenbacteria bacterium]
MEYRKRTLEAELIRSATAFSACIVTGPRRSGKTTLLRHCFPSASYVLLEEPDVIDRVRSDPRGFLEELGRPAILDEIQNTPELLNYIRAEIDRTPEQKGHWFLTGSQEAAVMRGVTESMAGRAAIFQLLPFSYSEESAVSLLKGGFPEVIARPATRDIWFSSYIQTYLERDVRAVLSIKDLATFRRFLALLATRIGQGLNKTALAGPIGVSVPTITEWLGVLEITAQILLVPPFFENFGKRITKAPKVYFCDSGLAAHLLGIETEASLTKSPFLGPLFEGLVASEIVKEQIHHGKSKAIYHFRDRQGLEVDFIVPRGGKRLTLIEAKATRTPRSSMAKPLLQLLDVIDKHQREAYVVHQKANSDMVTLTLAPGVKAIPWTKMKPVIL